jgi:hypothetical protein
MSDLQSPDQLAHGDNAPTQRHVTTAPDTIANAASALASGLTAPPPRGQLLTTVHNIPILKGFNNFDDWKGNAEALIVSHRRFYIIQDVNVPLTSTSVRRETPGALNALIPRPYREEDREDV